MLAEKRLKDWHLLAPAFVLAAAMALVNLGVGGPQVNIDDFTIYEAGFLVWFGHAPPQHAYLESWINGLASLFTYLVKGIVQFGDLSFVDLEFVSKAYSDFYYTPDVYYAAYRFVIVLFYLGTGALVYLIGRQCVPACMAGLAPAFSAILFLFSFNAFWCNLAGRPDTLVVFFAMIGILFYLKANYQDRSPWFWLAAASFGIAAGLKLHGAFFTIFAALDLLRVNGLRTGMRSFLLLALASVLFFVIADGTLLFDPLKYVKARVLTYQDDHSPYLVWGQQILTILRGSGWVAVPLALVGWLVTRNEQHRAEIRTILFFVLCWLALFLAIRQLRAYWMLPALPLFYLAVCVAIDRMKRLSPFVAAGIVLLFVTQSAAEVMKIHQADYDGLRRWVEASTTTEDAIYLVGFSVLRVPRTEAANSALRGTVEEGIRQDTKSHGFTYRHLKNWEEQTTLRLLEMLIPHAREGFNLYGHIEYRADFEKGGRLS